MNKKNLVSLSLLTTLMISGCAQKSPQATMPRTLAQTQTQAPIGEVTFGKASWYGEKYHGNTTAYGETYDMNAMTAAHKTLPHNTLVKVTDMVTKRSETVRINDKGPFVGGRIIDLSKGAAERLGFINRGMTDVRLEVVGQAGETTVAQNLPQGVGCVGSNCQAKITKAPSDMYAGTYNSFAKLPSQSVTENVSQNKIVTEQEQYFASLKQNTIALDEPSMPSVPSVPMVSNYVEKPSFTAPTVVPTYTPAYQEYKVADMMAPSSQIAIQVGAFRKLAGATVYSNRYRLLDVNHPVNIKNYTENAQPLFKVQIEGFSNETEAKEFMALHNLKSQGAFLVRR